MKLFSWLFGFNRNHNSKKARIYKEVDEQKGINNNRRQKQTNWLANKFNIYGGSRLPEDPNELIKQGWKDVTHPVKAKSIHNGMDLVNPKTKQHVEFDYGRKELGGFQKVNHYHWVNKKSKNRKNRYINKYGKECAYKSHESHILPVKKKRRRK